MKQADKAELFAKLHVKGNPLVLYNAWDAGSAKAILDAGSQAIATSSWSVAEAQGYRDGETMPLAFFQQIVARIAATSDAPVSVDFEGGYSDEDSGLAENLSPLLDSQIIGINFEDRVVKGAGLYDIDPQARRIAAIRAAARSKGIELFINARTDVFFGPGNPADLITDAIARARAYAAAGASGFFAPGLVDDALIGRLCASTELPVNVMVMDGVSSAKRLGSLGVARIRYAPIPYVRAMKSLKEQAQSALLARDLA
jgi:2-methylisocitrate lyase-like PEP mutase family enzyme